MREPKALQVFVDVETGGLDPSQHSLLSVGAIVAVDMVIVEEIEFDIKHPIYHVTPDALNVNKIDLRHRSGKTERQGILDFVDRLLILRHYHSCSYTQFYGHNVQFDMSFIRPAFKRAAIDEKGMMNMHHSFVDTYSAVKVLADCGLIKPEKYNLTKLAQYLGITVDETKTHGALYDAHLCYNVYSKVLQEIKNLALGGDS